MLGPHSCMCWLLQLLLLPGLLLLLLVVVCRIIS
jgi:hypothetical protein